MACAKFHDVGFGAAALAIVVADIGTAVRLELVQLLQVAVDAVPSRF